MNSSHGIVLVKKPNGLTEPSEKEIPLTTDATPAKKNKKFRIINSAVVIVAVTAALTVISVNYINSVEDKAQAQQTNIQQQYNATSAEVDEFATSVEAGLNIPEDEVAAAHPIIVDAVKGKYVDLLDPAADVGLHADLAEVAPSLVKDAPTYAKVQDFVQAGSEAYKPLQDSLTQTLAAYDTWLDSEDFESKVARHQKVLPSAEVNADIHQFLAG